MKRTILYIDDEVECLNSYRVPLTDSVRMFGVMPEVGAGRVQLFVPKSWTAEEMSRILERAGAHFESGGGGR